MLGVGGVTWIYTSVAAVTVSDAAGELTPLRLAVICVEPTPFASARPAEPPALPIVATAGFEEAQVTCEVRSCFDPSEKIPVAWNWAVVPLAALGAGGVISSDSSTAGVTPASSGPPLRPRPR